MRYYQCEQVNSTNKHYLLRYSNKEFVFLLKTVGLLWAFVRSQLPWEGEQQMIPDWNEFYQEMTEDKKKKKQFMTSITCQQLINN